VPGASTGKSLRPSGSDPGQPGKSDRLTERIRDVVTVRHRERRSSSEQLSQCQVSVKPTHVSAPKILQADLMMHAAEFEAKARKRRSS
jgi:hypothetical protein